MKDKMIVAMVGIGSIAAVEVALIATGTNGTVAVTVVAAICTIVGYAFGHFGKRKEY